MLKNEEPRLPVGTGRELNALAVEQNAGEPIARLIERFQATQGGIERLAALDRSHSLPVLTKAGAKPRTFEGLLRDVERHIRNHDARLRKGLRLTNPKPSLSRTV
ncbi:MAG: hypothetical protein Q8P59_13255 [Dehalococcoidia bacterium]|nr:hypothetical protein [Dehalococcoidia bacterium]